MGRCQYQPWGALRSLCLLSLYSSVQRPDSAAAFSPGYRVEVGYLYQNGALDTEVLKAATPAQCGIVPREAVPYVVGHHAPTGATLAAHGAVLLILSGALQHQFHGQYRHADLW